MDTKQTHCDDDNERCGPREFETRVEFSIQRLLLLWRDGHVICEGRNSVGHMIISYICNYIRVILFSLTKIIFKPNWCFSENSLLRKSKFYNPELRIISLEKGGRKTS